MLVIEPEEYELQIEGIGFEEPVTLTLSELQEMEQYTVTAAVQCAGNRRADMLQVQGIIKSSLCILISNSIYSISPSLL